MIGAGIEAMAEYYTFGEATTKPVRNKETIWNISQPVIEVVDRLFKVNTKSNIVTLFDWDQVMRRHSGCFGGEVTTKWYPSGIFKNEVMGDLKVKQIACCTFTFFHYLYGIG